MKKSYILLILLLISCSKEYVLRPQINGCVYNKEGVPINNAEVVFIDCSNSDCNGERPVYSDEKGRFVIKKEFMTYIFSKPHKYTRPYYSYTMTVKKEGYITDTIDIRKYEEDSNVIMLDTLYLIPK